MTHEPPLPEDLAEYAEAAARSPSGRHRPWLPVVAVMLLVVGSVVVGGVGYLLGRPTSSPADDSPEAGFARDMQVHHAQAVEMSLVVREKSTDPALRAMAYDVITSQQQQIGQMYAWLEGWGLPQTSSSAPMEWMSGMGHAGMAGMPSGSGSMKMLPDGRMPGMASPSDLARLGGGRGRAAEVLWLQLMIPHHQAGVMMAEAAIQKASDPQVVTLANAIRTAQLAEIEQMRQMLDERDAVEKTP
ncbi:MAG: DUF305 domain-containing protein [Pimelobacter sp.]|nr:DUF305 domain-containing protein [Pimelobacter sp.]